jgi:hypothetical protein
MARRWILALGVLAGGAAAGAPAPAALSLEGRSLVFFIAHERVQGRTYWGQHPYISLPGSIARLDLIAHGKAIATWPGI